MHDHNVTTRHEEQMCGNIPSIAIWHGHPANALHVPRFKATPWTTKMCEQLSKHPWYASKLFPSVHKVCKQLDTNIVCFTRYISLFKVLHHGSQANLDIQTRRFPWIVVQLDPKYYGHSTHLVLCMQGQSIYQGQQRHVYEGTYHPVV